MWGSIDPDLPVQQAVEGQAG